MHVMAANKPIVAPASTTGGRVSRLIANAPHKQAQPQRVQGRCCGITDGVQLKKGKSATNKSAHADIIQLNSSGSTDVDGGLVNGLSHGSATHNASNVFRKPVEAISKGMIKLFVGPACLW